jgi:hypothetical protein
MAGSSNVAAESRRMCFATLPHPCNLFSGSGRAVAAFWACRKKRLIQTEKMAGKDGDGEDGFRGALGGAEADAMTLKLP